MAARILLLAGFIGFANLMLGVSVPAQTSAPGTRVEPSASPRPQPPPKQNQQQGSGAKRPSRSKTARPAPQPTPEPAVPEPLPQLPPPLAEQALPYSVRYIDRPYTLPKGLYDIRIEGSMVYSESVGDSFYFPPYLLDLRYRQPLTNDFTLLWNPIPLGVQYQPKRSEKTVSGVSWSLGWQYQGNVGLKPQFSSYLRHTLNKGSAIEMELDYFTFLPFKSAPSVWSTQFRIGPIFQQSNQFVMGPRIALAVDNTRLENTYTRGRTPIENKNVISSAARFTMPFSFWMQWTWHPNWDASLEYTLLGSGLHSNAYTQLVTLGITSRW